MSTIYRDDRAEPRHRYVASQDSPKHYHYIRLGVGSTPEKAVLGLSDTPFAAGRESETEALVWLFAGSKRSKARKHQHRVQDLDELMDDELITAMSALPPSDEYVAWLQTHGEDVLEPWTSPEVDINLGQTWWRVTLEGMSDFTDEIPEWDAYPDDMPETARKVQAVADRMQEALEDAAKHYRNGDVVAAIDALVRAAEAEDTYDPNLVFVTDVAEEMLTALGLAIFKIRTP